MLACCVLASAQAPASPSRVPAQPVSADEPATGAITGSVVSESGQPLAGVTVSVWDASQSGGHRTTSTDAEGNFRVRGLIPSLYFVTAFLPAYTRISTDASIPGNYHRVGDTVKITLLPGGVITGKVTNAEGEPVIGVGVRAVMIRNASNETPQMGSLSISDAPTDDRGIYRIFGMAPGTYIVSAGGMTLPEPFKLNPYDSDVPTYAPSATRDTASEIVVRTGEESVADIRYRGDSGHVVSGTIKVSAAAGGSVSLTAAGSVFPTAHAFQQPGGGGFAFRGVADGEYDLVAQSIPVQTGAIVDVPMSEPQHITVKGADITGLEFVPRPLASLGGQIVLQPAKVAACENKRRPLFAEMLVALQRPERDEKERLTYLRVFARPGNPDANGNFAIKNLMPGKYLLDPSFFARYWYLQSVSVATTPKIDAAANWTNVKFGDQISNFTITIAEGAASIRGKVTTANAAELPAGLAVYLLPAERDKFADVLRYFVTPVETSGAFALNNLAPGRYQVAMQTLDANTGTLFKLRLPEATEARAKLRRVAETQKTELELKPCQNLTDQQVTFKP
jgi:hypothetical protein